MASIEDFIHQIEIRTAVPGVSFTYDLTTPSDPRTQAILNAIKPVIYLRGPLGNFKIDYLQGATGAVNPAFESAGYQTIIGGAAALLGAGLVLKALLGRR